ncbi:MAG: ATP-binding cassette domain-containing protein [Eubacteriales bacterium]|nr:ATP-binding cassette domain-containing protein [Eubacteriales bacterium]
MKIKELLTQYPFVADFFEQNRLEVSDALELTFPQFLESLSEEEREEKAIDPAVLTGALDQYMQQMSAFLGLDDDRRLRSLTILPGHDKTGKSEGFSRLDIYPSQILSIVGPTGAGKSRLLADIEWAAQGDTPTGRSILINDGAPDPKWRYSPNNKLVAQLSQNMNFVMDLRVGEFLQLHAQSRMAENGDELCRRILKAANELAGESFDRNTPVTSLSGGQSRALMIADTAILSASPIILIDEIENAGIDRQKALQLLVSEEKIVLMATHDPLLALLADRRIVIRGGGICSILETSPEEKELLQDFYRIDEIMQDARRRLRAGERLCAPTQ